MSVETELLPCPFCNASAFIFIERKEKYKFIPYNLYTAACVGCGANIPWETDSRKAVDNWNKRA